MFCMFMKQYYTKLNVLYVYETVLHKEKCFVCVYEPAPDMVPLICRTMHVYETLLVYSLTSGCETVIFSHRT